MRLIRAVSSAILAIFIAGATPSFAASPIGLEPSVPRAYNGARKAAPMAFLEFCIRYASHCAPTRGRAGEVTRSGAVKANAGRFGELQAINRSVNQAIRPVSDATQYGVKDRWRVGVARGDCEDYVLEKRRRLIARGWPSSAVLIALGRARGQQHAVLIARTSEGDYVLDNLTGEVLPIRRAHISISQVQSPDNPRIWRSF
ncbi:transglutaminase-like cysteine peptidase [Stappia sp. F7233]|uniref:Transglutaminase-like cysteine peptidase n=1 Tax=Stappia albiluteola TaxID=2758565 RepID=A0A839ADB4_9HYPH|nr:transglutaminase-like cysteine peptidase [Stappia albiluteola]MBA5777136.1 transglutaminase-like cysteine peptidase [Stappia albiluteola]